METEVVDVQQEQAVATMSYASIVGSLKEKNADEEFVRCCAVEELTQEVNGFKSVMHFGNPYDEDMVPISIASRVSAEEANRILENIVPIQEMAEILEYMATSMQSRSMVIIEGETSVGKTLGINTFTKLLFGEECTPIDFYCKGQTDNTQLMGTWVPNVRAGNIDRQLAELKQTAEGQALLSSLSESSPETEDFADILVELNKRLSLPQNTQWEFQYGAIPKAMVGTKDVNNNFSMDLDNPQGFIMHMQEAGLAEGSVVDTTLALRGERARLAASIQLWEFDGRTIVAGDYFMIAISTNPPENYIDRNELDSALWRNAESLRIGHLQEESLKRMAKETFTFAMPGARVEKPQRWNTDIRDATELGKATAKLVSQFHQKVVAALKGGEAGRAQRIIPSLDDFDRVRSRLIREQVLVADDGGLLKIDMVATLKRALRKVYLNRLSDGNKINELTDVLDKLLTDDDLGREEFRGEQTHRETILKTLADEHFERLKDDGSIVDNGLGDAVINARQFALQSRARERWNRLAAAGKLPAVVEGNSEVQ